MKGFQIITPVSRAYQFVWSNRRMCATYSVFPFMAQFLCYAALVMMNMQDNLLRQGLFMLPAYFVEGAVVTLLVKTALEALPQQGALFTTSSPPSDDIKKRLTAGTIVFVLLQMAFVVGMAFWLKFMIAQGMLGRQPAEPTTQTALISITIMMAVLWAVRLMWLYVPIVMGFPIKRYLRIFAPFHSSFYMIAIAFLCAIPVMFVAWIAIEFMITALGIGPDEMNAMTLIVLSLFQIVAGLVTTLLTSIAMAYALYPFMSAKNIDKEI